MSGNNIDQPESTPSEDAAAAETPVAPVTPLPPENFVRGLLLALLAIPAGIAAYLVVWNLGFIASIVGLGIAFAALWLYRLGSGGRVSMRGGVVITVITLGTLALAFFLGEVWDYVAFVMGETGMTAQEVLAVPGFWDFFAQDMAIPEVASAVTGDAIMATIFGLLGCAGVLVNVFRSAKAQREIPEA